MAVFVNQATLSYSGGTVTSNIASGEIIEVLSADKTAVVNEYTQGSEITYAINIINTGDTPFTGITLTDDLGATTIGTDVITPLEYITDSVKVFADGVLQPAPTVTAVSPLTITGITVPASGVVTVLYTVQVNTFASPEATGTITNTAQISGGTADLTVTETITAQQSPNLNIVKSVSPVTVNENGTLTYTFTIQNTGNEDATATDAVVITDTFDPQLSDLTVTYNGDPWTAPTNYTYDEQTGLFQTASGSITVPAATFAQNPTTGEWVITPGTAVVTVTGTL